MNRSTVAMLVLGTLLAALPVVNAQDNSKSEKTSDQKKANENKTDKSNKKETRKPLAIWHQYSEAVVKDHTLRFKDSRQKVELIEEPVFIHNYNIDKESHALVYLWTTDVGRPVAVVTAIVMRTTRKDSWREINEFHSFHDSGFQVMRNGGRRWSPTGNGVDWVEVPNTPVPAQSLVKQKFQARQISRRFSITANYSYKAVKEWKLRLIPKPINEYHTKESGQLVSGYLNVFCLQNDPESILAIEVRKNTAGEYRWHYGAANYTDGGVHVSLDGTEVWSDDPASFGNRHVGFVANTGISLSAELAKLRKKQSR